MVATGGKRDHVTFVPVPVLEIIIKIAMLGFAAYYEHRKQPNRDE